jgi:chemotaxis protein MotB
MSGSAHGRRRGGGGGDGGHEDGGGAERWLLTYADMITLLLALFIVLWSISSVNISKFDDLKTALHQAFSGKVVNGNVSILSGGSSLLQPQGTPVPTVQPMPSAPTIPNIKASIRASISSALEKQDIENLARMKQNIDAYAKAHGLSGQLRTSVDQRGLVIHVLTDQLLFAPGQAMLEPQAAPLLDHVAQLLTLGGLANPVRVEGNTDNVPIKTPQFRSNWELSAARASAVLEFLLGRGVQERRLSLAGYADQDPIASNSTAAGRGRNRRVDIVILRRS